MTSVGGNSADSADCKANKRRWLKPLELAGQVVFARVCVCVCVGLVLPLVYVAVSCSSWPYVSAELRQLDLDRSGSFLQVVAAAISRRTSAHMCPVLSPLVAASAAICIAARQQRPPDSSATGRQANIRLARAELERVQASKRTKERNGELAADRQTGKQTDNKRASRVKERRQRRKVVAQVIAADLCDELASWKVR